MTTGSLLGEYVHEPITDDSELLWKIQDVFLEIQRTVLDAGGTIRQFILDDKGDPLQLTSFISLKPLRPRLHCRLWYASTGRRHTQERSLLHENPPMADTPRRGAFHWDHYRQVI